MKAYELLAKLRLLILIGKYINGELTWMGTTRNWNQVSIEEENILREWDLKQTHEKKT